MIEITPARPSHLPDLLTMIRALSAFHGDEATVTLEHLQDLFFGDADAATAIVAMQEHRAIGYAALTRDIVLHEGSLRMDIHHLFVSETHRAQGVGTALISAAREVALERGATRLTIGTDPRNGAAIAAYRAIEGLDEMLDPGPRFRVRL